MGNPYDAIGGLEVGEFFQAGSGLHVSIMAGNRATFTSFEGLPPQVTAERLQAFGIMVDMVTAIMLATLETGIAVFVLVCDTFVRVW